MTVNLSQMYKRMLSPRRRRFWVRRPLHLCTSISSLLLVLSFFLSLFLSLSFPSLTVSFCNFFSLWLYFFCIRPLTWTPLFHSLDLCHFSTSSSNFHFRPWFFFSLFVFFCVFLSLFLPVSTSVTDEASLDPFLFLTVTLFAIQY